MGEVQSSVHFHLHDNFKYPVDEKSIVLGGDGVRERRKDEKVEKNMAIYSSFLCVPRILGGYC